MFNIRRNRTNSVTIKGTQFSLTLTFSRTIHKVQDIGLQKDVISFALSKQKSFMSDQMYVALSQVSKLSGMYLEVKSAIKVNKVADEECAQIRTEQLFVPIFISKTKETNFAL